MALQSQRGGIAPEEEPQHESPPPGPGESSILILSPYEGMKSFSLALSYPTAAEAQRVFDVLTERTAM